MREEIVRKLVDEVKTALGDGYFVEPKETNKNNGVELRSIAIEVNGEEIIPVIHVGGLIDEIENGNMTVAEAAQRVLEEYQKHRDPEFKPDIKKLVDKQYILNHVEYELVNAERNEQKLQNAPTKKIADLAAIYRVIISRNEEETSGYVIGDRLLEMTGISMEELDEAAMRNTQRTEFTVRTMCDVMAEIMDTDEEMMEEIFSGPQTYVLSNSRNTKGANILLCKGQMKKVAELLHGDFYILPSSIHEVLAIPVLDSNIEELRETVRQANDNVVAPEEILSYEVYRCSRETGEIEAVA